jgi:hypothetical protein
VTSTFKLPYCETGSRIERDQQTRKTTTKRTEKTGKTSAKMSDIGDEMDVDVPAVSKDVIFSSETKQGKRSAANLPVEAEDSLPW